MKVRGFEFVDEKHKKGDDGQLPLRATKTSAGYDFYSNETIIIPPFNKHVFWTNVKAYMQENEVLQLYVRSSIGIKKGLVLANGTGIIDADYYSNADNDGNIGICLSNNSDCLVTIEKGERIAQGIFLSFLVADNCNSENERNGGIGSTN
jgi:dUTP pyrophosphatase